MMNCFRTIREFSKKTQQNVADYLGISRVAYTNYENDKREPDMKTLIKLADYFSVSLDELVGRSSQSSSILNFDHDEIELIKKYRSLDEDGKRRVLRNLDGEYEDAQGKSDESLQKTIAG